jgi:hypothetical protein
LPKKTIVENCDKDSSRVYTTRWLDLQKAAWSRGRFRKRYHLRFLFHLLNLVFVASSFHSMCIFTPYHPPGHHAVCPENRRLSPPGRYVGDGNSTAVCQTCSFFYGVVVDGEFCKFRRHVILREVQYTLSEQAVTSLV